MIPDVVAVHWKDADPDDMAEELGSWMKALSGEADPKPVDCGDGSDEKAMEEEDDEELMPKWLTRQCLGIMLLFEMNRRNKDWEETKERNTK